MIWGNAPTRIPPADPERSQKALYLNLHRRSDNPLPLQIRIRSLEPSRNLNTTNSVFRNNTTFSMNILSEPECAIVGHCKRNSWEILNCMGNCTRNSWEILGSMGNCMGNFRDILDCKDNCNANCRVILLYMGNCKKMHQIFHGDCTQAFPSPTLLWGKLWPRRVSAWVY